jgi:DNA-binding MarR family transcriptional regulator
VSAQTTTPIDLDVVVRLRAAVARLARLLRQQDPSDFGPTLTAALFTIANEGPLTLGDLAAMEQVAPPTITKAVDKLEARGLVERVTDPSDRRVRQVAVTLAGRQHLDAARSRRTEWLVAQLERLTDDELARLGAAVDVLERLTVAP